LFGPFGRLANRKGYEGFEDLAELVSQMVG
jgi:hypothetical protein